MLLNDNQYLEVVEKIKCEISKSQYKAALAVNSELIMLYYNIGKMINGNKTWGNKFIDNLAKDIKLSYPDITGFSVRNLKYMAKFASLYPDCQIVQEVLAQLTWYHNITLLDKIKDTGESLWYARETLKNGWSRNVLVHQSDRKQIV